MFCSKTAGFDYSTYGESNAKESATFSWRLFFSTINQFRILQKLVKKRVHRNLLLFQYEVWTIASRFLHIPHHGLFLYILKVLKGQVSLSGRRWRQANMRLITWIYLHCRPELKDDWIATSDYEVDVDEALVHENAMRSLTRFYNLQRYPSQVNRISM